MRFWEVRDRLGLVAGIVGLGLGLGFFFWRWIYKLMREFGISLYVCGRWRFGVWVVGNMGLLSNV